MDPVTAALILAILGKVAIGLGVAGIVALASKSPKAIRWFKRYLLGKNILVLGHARAGKTSFYNYLKDDLFADTHPTMRTDRVSPVMRFPVDKHGNLKFDVSNAFDIPGDLSIAEQIDILRRKKPAALLIFLSPLQREDVPADEEWLPAVPWLRLFTGQLNKLLSDDYGVAKKLRCIKVVLNKSDTVEARDLEETSKQLRNIIQEELGELVGTRSEDIKVLSCTLRKDKGGELAANTVILELISCLKKDNRLVKT